MTEYPRLRFHELNGPRPRKGEPGWIVPEIRWSRAQKRDLVGGHFYPLDVRRALDMARGVAYGAACAERAILTPESARRMTERREATKRARGAGKIAW